MFFFFQAEDGIRDVAVTGVQTCALPISIHTALCHVGMVIVKPLLEFTDREWDETMEVNVRTAFLLGQAAARAMLEDRVAGHRSEERRVGKECRSRWSPYH